MGEGGGQEVDADVKRSRLYMLGRASRVWWQDMWRGRQGRGLDVTGAGWRVVFKALRCWPVLGDRCMSRAPPFLLPATPLCQPSLLLPTQTCTATHSAAAYPHTLHSHTCAGDRACVDLACLMQPGEGMLVGSLAAGLFLVSGLISVNICVGHLLHSVCMHVLVMVMVRGGH